MAKACACNAGLSNTGTGCSPFWQVAVKLIVVPYYDSDGNQNSIDLTDTLNQAYFTALINQADTSLRWLPLPSMLNVEDTRAESLMETFENGSMMFVQQGARSFKSIVAGRGATPQLLGNLGTFRCVPFGVYGIDKQGNIIGSIGTQDPCDITLLYPIRIDENSWDPTWIKPTDKTAQKINIAFYFHMDEDDASLRMITADEHNANLLTVNGLLDVCSEYSNLELTSFTVTLNTYFGTLLNPVRVEGLVITDFALYNVTDSASVTISTLTETSDGVYDLTFAAQTGLDELRLTPTQTGYDFAAVVANTIDLPAT
jgi:hypothetical protein